MPENLNFTRHVEYLISEDDNQARPLVKRVKALRDESRNLRTASRGEIGFAGAMGAALFMINSASQLLSLETPTTIKSGSIGLGIGIIYMLSRGALNTLAKLDVDREIGALTTALANRYLQQKS